MNTETVGQQTCFKLKGSMYPLSTIQVLDPTLNNFEAELKDKILQAPKFFQHAPVIIDLQKLINEEKPINFTEIKELLIKNQLIPVGIRSGNKMQKEAAILAGLAIFPEQKTEASETTPAKTAKTEDKSESNKIITSPDETQSKTRLITQPVRSGQQIYAQGGDLIVLSTVSHGAELLADGHIHVYGPLRGRALAGITGETNARIFCQSLEAELISIAGNYQVSEEINKTSYWEKSVKVLLDKNHLKIQLQ